MSCLFTVAQPLQKRPAKKEIGEKYGSKHARQVGNKPAGHGIPHAFYTDGAKINGQDLKGGLGAPLNDGRQMAGKAHPVC